MTIGFSAALAAITGILLFALGSLVGGGLLNVLALLLIAAGGLGLLYTLLLQADAQSQRADGRAVNGRGRRDASAH